MKQRFYLILIVSSIFLQAGSGICGKYASLTTGVVSPFMTIFNVFSLTFGDMPYITSDCLAAGPYILSSLVCTSISESY